MTTRIVRTALITAGVLVMALAAAGAVADHGVRPVPQALFAAALVVGNDALLLPAAIGVGRVVGRVVPALARAISSMVRAISGAACGPGSGPSAPVG